MQDRDVGGAVVGHHPLDPDPVRLVVGDSPFQEADRGDGLLVGEDLDVGDPGRVIDTDVDVLPAGRTSGMVRARLMAPVAGDPVSDAAADPSELLDVNVEQLTRSLALVAVRRLGRLQTGELAEPDPGQHRGDRRERHRQRLRDLRASETQPTQRSDRGDPLLAGTRRHPGRGRGTIKQTIRTLGTEPSKPLRDRADTHTGSLGRPRQRPALLQHPLHDQPTRMQTGTSVTVQLHPGPPSDWVASTPPASKEARMEQRSWELHLAPSRRFGTGTFGFYSSAA